MTRQLPTIALLALSLFIIAVGLTLQPVQGFVPSFGVTNTATTTTTTTTTLQASAGKNNKRRRRRRTTTEPVKENAPTSASTEHDDDDVEIISEKEGLTVETPPGFEFQPPTADLPILTNECTRTVFFRVVESHAPDPSTVMPVGGSNEGPIPLPDIRDQLKRKELQEKISKMEAEEQEKK
eukprot:scaffold6038_cov125-Amphora_coffeaeformis.AAC.6